MPNETEAQKAQEIQDAYNAQKTLIASQSTQIAALQQQVANGTPATADQIAALAIVDATATEVETDEAAAAPTPTPSA